MNIDTAYSEMVFAVWMNSFSCMDTDERAIHMTQNSGNPPFPEAKWD